MMWLTRMNMLGASATGTATIITIITTTTYHSSSSSTNTIATTTTATTTTTTTTTIVNGVHTLEWYQGHFGDFSEVSWDGPVWALDYPQSFWDGMVNYLMTHYPRQSWRWQFQMYGYQTGFIELPISFSKENCRMAKGSH